MYRDGEIVDFAQLKKVNPRDKSGVFQITYFLTKRTRSEYCKNHCYKIVHTMFRHLNVSVTGLIPLFRNVTASHKHIVS